MARYAIARSWQHRGATSRSRPATPIRPLAGAGARARRRGPRRDAPARHLLRRRARPPQAPRAEARGAELIQYRRAGRRPGPARATTGSCRSRTPTHCARRSTRRSGTLVVVEKRRRLLLWEGVRIHLDEVEGLGSFVELEAPERLARRWPRSNACAPSSRSATRSRRELLRPAARDPRRCCCARPRRQCATPTRRTRGSRSAPRCGPRAAPSTRAPTSRTPPTRRASAPRRRRSVRWSRPARREIAAVAVVAEQMDVCPPCGGCRQRLSEFAGPERPSTSAARDDDDDRRAAAAVFSLEARRELARGSARAGRTRRRPSRAWASCWARGSARWPTPWRTRSSCPTRSCPASPAGRGGSRRPRRGGPHRRACRWWRSRAAPTSTRASTASRSARPVRALKAAGAEILVLTNAAGSLRADLGPGSLMLIEDHINLTGVNLLTGPNDDELGPRFPSLRDAYDPELRARLRAAAAELGVDARRGRLPRGQRPELRDAGRDPRLPHARAPTPSACRPSTRRSSRATAGCAWPAVSAITNLAEGMGERAGQPRADAARRRPRRGRPGAAAHPFVGDL